MKQPIPIETLLKYFVEQIEVSVDFVATQVPFTPEKNVSIAFTFVDKPGLYYDGAKEWRSKLAIDKTWDKFKEMFLPKSSTKFV